MEVKRNNRKNASLFFMWILIGLIISFIFCSIRMSENSSIYSFYNVGDIYEISKSIYDTPNMPIYGCEIKIYGNENQWNYLCVELKNIDKVYIGGYGAKFIKELLNWIEKSEFVLDRFHLLKYINQATADFP